ncbi:N(4)-(Beta-N-acetylglucosaminyl)-L-asparaginase [Condylostylus longicornis]|uniref:N(4)-(Beta-N-acetylglucosaminyl)-L-asparaginase n=1 Tax=Condylostylus longicornis TaxID=2530218 RepID=UPI00244DFB2F|nr:N(4)-(Beta-N-acetylglucosaminyl)-L-asparaginase [Condylostylus longicornis]
MLGFVLFLVLSCNAAEDKAIPLVINTWKFTEATERAWEVLSASSNALNALVAGCSRCEELQCDGTVGPGSPDESGETTLDALIMDGENMNIGAVANLREIKNAIGVAKHVLLQTEHSLLSGSQATDFAVSMGFQKESLSTNQSKKMWENWRNSNCQPNFWRNVKPNPKSECGPYSPIKRNDINSCDKRMKYNFNNNNHDTIGMIVIDSHSHIYAGTSTNGAKFKIPGRVGDSPIPGAGAYAENGIGAAAATGDGDVMMRFLPSFTAVENLRNGMQPREAAKNAIDRILKYYPDFTGAVIVARYTGEFSAACAGMKKFPFSVRRNKQTNVQVIEIDCELSN